MKNKLFFKKLFLGFALFLVLCFGLMAFSSVKTKAITRISDELAYQTDIDNPATISEIMEEIGLCATDDDGTDLTEKIVYVDSGDYINRVLNQPFSYTREVGLYTITFKAYDKNGNSSTFTVNVDVIDNTNPIIVNNMSKLSYTFYRSEISSETYNIIRNGIFAYDNVDLFNVDKDIEAYTFNRKSVCGNYKVRVIVSDQIGNSSVAEVSVTIVDDINPYFTMENGFYIADEDDDYSVDEIAEIAGVKAFSSSGTSLTVNYNENGYSKNNVVPGNYVFTFSATDSEGHTATIDFIYVVPDKKGPVFSYDDSVLVSKKGNLYTDENINTMIKFRSGRSDYTYKVIEDEYTLNYNNVGEYNYKVELTYETGESEIMTFLFKVIDVNPDTVKTNHGIWYNTFMAVKKIGNIIVKIMKWPIIRVLNIK